MYEFTNKRLEIQNVEIDIRHESKILTNEFISSITRKFNKFKCKKCGSENFTYSFIYDINRLSV